MNRDKKSTITSVKSTEVIGAHKVNLSAVMPKPAGAPVVVPGKRKPAELGQDAGGGYNADGTFPQR